MPKNILRDVLPSERRTIRHISMPDREKTRGVEGGDIIYEREESANPLPIARRRRGRSYVWIGTGAGIFLLLFFLGSSVRGATITVSPKRAPISLNADFTTARKMSEGLRFTALPLSASAEEVIPADKLKKVSERAQGTISIYNNYSKETQRLIKNTRFESPKGLIYRIDRSIVIPGKTVRDGKAIPGSVEAVVYADSPGEEYNSAATDFTIPGFKSNPARYAAFYARSKTPLTGGVDGMIRTPSDEAIEAAQFKLRGRLQSDIRAQGQRAVSGNSILYDDALVIKFESLPLEARGSEKAAVRERATGSAYLFSRRELAEAIARKAIRGYNGLPVEIAELDTFGFSFVPPLPSATAETIELKFTLQGNGNVTWIFEEEGLTAALLGKSRDDLATVLSGFPTIEKIDVAIRPFWSRRLPENPKKIEVKKAAAAAVLEQTETDR